VQRRGCDQAALHSYYSSIIKYAPALMFMTATAHKFTQ